MYLVIAICAIINFYYFKFDNVGNILNSTFACVFLLVIVILPIFFSIFYFKNFQKFVDQDKNYISRFGSLV